MTDVKMILVSAQGKILPEAEEELGDDALQKPVSYTHLTLPTICSV